MCTAVASIMIKDQKEHCVKALTHLMFRGQGQSAVHFITDRVHGGRVLSLDTSTGVPGHFVLDILLKKHPEPGVIDESAFCQWITSLLCLTWASLLTMWNVWLTKFRDLQGLVYPLHCSGMDIFFTMVCPVHVCAMLLLCWPTTWQMELWIESVYTIMCFDGWLADCFG